LSQEIKIQNTSSVHNTKPQLKPVDCRKAKYIGSQTEFWQYLIGTLIMTKQKPDAGHVNSLIEMTPKSRKPIVAAFLF